MADNGVITRVAQHLLQHRQRGRITHLAQAVGELMSHQRAFSLVQHTCGRDEERAASRVWVVRACARGHVVTQPGHMWPPHKTTHTHGHAPKVSTARAPPDVLRKNTALIRSPRGFDRSRSVAACVSGAISMAAGVCAASFLRCVLLRHATASEAVASDGTTHTTHAPRTTTGRRCPTENVGGWFTAQETGRRNTNGKSDGHRNMKIYDRRRTQIVTFSANRCVTTSHSTAVCGTSPHLLR